MQRCPSRMVERQTRVRLDGRLLEEQDWEPSHQFVVEEGLPNWRGFLAVVLEDKGRREVRNLVHLNRSEGRHGRGLEGKLYRLCLEAVDEDDAMGEVVPLADRGRAGDEGGKKDDENFRRFR